MIEIKDKKNCCGCSACVSICPKHCITMQEDSEGFLYPQVDERICVNCGLCEKVCNELHPYDTREPLQVLAAINKNEDIRLKSSSGGIFHLLAEKTIREGGLVFGARFDENWQVVIDYAEDMKGVEAFMGSKYVQARMENAYVDAKRFLNEGRKVLFSGTPCQVAGLHRYLRKPYDNLLSVDFICHGVPSPKVWKIYLEEVVKQVQSISSVEFRNKEKGWKKFGFILRHNEIDKTVSMLSPFTENHYMKAFLNDIILRPSCYECKARGCSSQSDITIADFWGIETLLPEMDDDKGTSLVLVNTNTGKLALDVAQITMAASTYDCVKKLNSACFRSPKVHPKREMFFMYLGKKKLISLIDDCMKLPFRRRLGMLKWRCKLFVKCVLKLLCHRVGGGKKQKYKRLGGSDFAMPTNSKIVSVSFRCKDDGWKKYNVEIKVK